MIRRRQHEDPGRSIPITSEELCNFCRFASPPRIEDTASSVTVRVKRALGRRKSPVRLSEGCRSGIKDGSNTLPARFREFVRQRSLMDLRRAAALSARQRYGASPFRTGVRVERLLPTVIRRGAYASVPTIGSVPAHGGEDEDRTSKTLRCSVGFPMPCRPILVHLSHPVHIRELYPGRRRKYLFQ